jgi:murein L,D-transpeptidase YcbB/YkuD
VSRTTLLGSLGCVVLLAVPAAAQQADSAALIIRGRVETLRAGGSVTVQGARLLSVDALPSFYAQRDYRPAWSDPARLAALRQAVRASAADGLDPTDYLLGPLDRLTPLATAPRASATQRAELDLLATEALIRLAFSLRYGKVNPANLGAAWGAQPATPPGPPPILEALVSSDTLVGAIAALAPRHALYLRLRTELARYRAADSTGGWPVIDPGPVLEVGMTDPRVPAVRRRLAATGDLPASAATAGDEHYDRGLSGGVARFQARLGLVVDGLLGPRTRAELNAPPILRIKTLRVNLERARWVLPGLGSTFVAVNIPAYRAYFVRDDSLVWSGRAVVGEPYLQTPEFQSRITWLVLNPTWTVPPQILTDEVLPDIRRDSTYLARNGMEVLDREDAVVDPTSVDWDQYDGRTLPYRIVQTPGGGNPLGRVKFVFPNPYAVYLHDTPARGLFQRSQRTFSHGCIRVQHPMALATALMDDSAWTSAALDSVVALKAEATLALPRPVPVLILYWTAWPAEDGALNFRPDVYGRDSAVLAALNAPFSFTAADP